MNVQDILQNKDTLIKKVYKDTEVNLQKIISKKLSEYDIKIVCPERGYDELIIHDDNKWIKFYLCKFAFKNGSYVKIGSKGSGDFTRTEVRNMMERLNGLFKN